MSGFLKLNAKDFIKGLIVTMIGAAISTAIEIIKGGLNLTKADAVQILTVAIIAGASYLLKNLGTDNDTHEKFVGLVKTK